MGIKLIKNTFYREKEVKSELKDFLSEAERFSMGKWCRKFEKKFSNWQKRKHAIFVSSGSAANLALIQALLNLGRIEKGDKIAFSSLTWATNVMPIIQLGLKPVPIDCEIQTLNSSLEKLKEKLDKNPDIKAFFITNTLGFCSNLDEIRDFCRKNDILLLEDNCESLGSRLEGELLGNFGLASTFSFYVGHHLSTIEGGIICTNDDDLANALRMVRAHGWARNLEKKDQEKMREKHNIDSFFDLYTFYELGYNLRPTEINGFLGVKQLEFLSEIIERRENNFKVYNRASQGNDDIIPLNINHIEKVSNFAMPLIFKSRKSFLNYKEKFEKEEIEIRPVIAGNIVKQPFYRKYFNTNEKLPNSNKVHRQGFYVPNNADLTEKEVNKIRGLIEENG